MGKKEERMEKGKSRKERFTLRVKNGRKMKKKYRGGMKGGKIKENMKIRDRKEH